MLSAASALLLAVTAVPALAQSSYGSAAANASSSPAFLPFSGNPFQKYSLSAKGINATFIPYGARITSLFVNDKSGKPQDVVLGYDNARDYLKDTETSHTFFGAVVGRYANRIKNGTFTIDGQTSHITENENGGKDTLHGGIVGYDQQNWTVAAHTADSITFIFYDQAQSGFPGNVLNVATYTLTDEPAWVSRLVSFPLDKTTPIMLANHAYWNLGAFTTPSSVTVLNDVLTMPLSQRYIEVDGILIPTGAIGVVEGTPLDFTKGKTIGKDINSTLGVCGTGCTGYDNAFIVDRKPYTGPKDPETELLSLYSPATGIKLTVESDQQGLQIYSCNGQNGTIPVKKSQQHGASKGNTTYVEKYGCLVIETQDWIDGINNPQWGREDFQIFSPTTEPAVNYAKFKFSVGA